YHANGFLAEAGECERALVELEPSNPRWLYLRAHTIGGYGNLDEALPMLEDAIKLAPDYLPARIPLADALLKQNDIDGARLGYQEVLNRDPHHGYAVVGMARTELSEDRPEAARQRLQGYVAVRPEFVPAWT